MIKKHIAGDIAGLDIGSRSIELVVLRNSEPVHSIRVSTTYDPLKQCRLILADIDVQSIVATGYGRKLFAESNCHADILTITEIQAYALGVHSLFPEAGTILDIGGQDTKAIRLSKNGKIFKFEMNDRCAAGTGKFLEYMAVALQIPLKEFGDFALKGDRKVPIGSMCTVFAETEATSLMARGEKTENIALGLHEAIAQRTLKMLNRIGLVTPLIFAGGVAHNPCIIQLLKEKIDADILIPPDPDFAGALGAAIWGFNKS